MAGKVPRVRIEIEVDLLPEPKARLVSASYSGPTTPRRRRLLRAAIRRAGFVYPGWLDVLEQGIGPQNDVRWALGLPLLTEKDVERVRAKYRRRNGR